MKSPLITSLFTRFESAASTYQDVECWCARELQTLLGYTKWENFAKVIDKAKEVCNNAGFQITDHFPDVRKMIEIGKGAQRNVTVIQLWRDTCCLFAQTAKTYLMR